jgi:DMSO/TMAO reductase YedYZ molybdopterin-dependent catalytic subunit
MLPRRELLIGGAAALFAGCEVQRPSAGFWGAMDRVNERVQRGLFRPGSFAAPPPEKALTPEDAFPKYKIGADFPYAPAGWRLEVTGWVRNPLSLTLSQLQGLTRTDMRIRHYCVEGWSAVASWQGVALRELAALAGADPAAPYVELVSFEQAPAVVNPEDAKAGPDAAARRVLMGTYRSSWDRESALHRQTMLAYGMNGRPLSREHGGPLRLYSTTKLGYKMVKWLAAVRFLPQRTGGYWEDHGYEWFAGV